MTSGLFVGRRDVLALMDEVAEKARNAEPRAVVVGGPAGMGKTRVMEHAVTRPAFCGMRVLRGACVELGTEGLPMAPVTAVLRQLAAEPGVAALRRSLPGVEGLLRLVPELDQDGRGPEPRARVFELFGALLRTLGEERPVVWLVDDLQWADSSTRDLLDVLLRTLGRARVLVLAAYRSDDLDDRNPLRPVLAQWARLPHVHRTTLEPLSRPEVAELVGGDERLAERVFRRSAGNPLFAEELARAGTDGVPDSLRDLVLARVHRLPDAARHVVRVAAVGGTRVTHALLAATCGMPDAGLLDALRAASTGRVLVAAGDGYAFQHGLIREAVVADLLPVERIRFHRAYAEALRQNPGFVAADRYAAELAYHWHGAGVPDEALPATLRAAEVAGRLHAPAEQAHLLERALDLWDRAERPPADVDRLGLYETAIAAAAWSGENLRAVDLIDRALAEADRTREPARTAILLAQRGMALSQLDREGALPPVDEALDLLPGLPAEARARVLDLCAAALTVRGAAERGRELAAEATRLAAEAGDAALEINARNTEGWAACLLGAYDDGVRVLRAALGLARREGDDLGAARAALNLAGALHDLGLDDEAIATARDGLEAARRSGVERTLGALIAARLVAALADAGRWEEAMTAGREGLALDPAGPHGTDLHIALAETSLFQGFPDGVRDHLAAARTVLGRRSDPRVSRVDALLALYENRPDDARRLIAETLPAMRTVADWPSVAAAALIAHATHASGLTEEVRAIASRLPTPTPVAAAHAQETAAHLEARAQNTTDGPQWAKVVKAWEQVGRPYAAARARVRAAESALAERDRDAALALLREAALSAERLGAAPLAEDVRLLARSAHLPLTAPAAAEAPGLDRLGLTEREKEVLRLVAAGRSNRQIGEELFITAKTVSVHVSNILGKLNAGSRGEAAAVAHRLGLFDND